MDYGSILAPGSAARPNSSTCGINPTAARDRIRAYEVHRNTKEVDPDAVADGVGDELTSRTIHSFVEKFRRAVSFFRSPTLQQCCHDEKRELYMPGSDHARWVDYQLLAQVST